MGSERFLFGANIGAPYTCIHMYIYRIVDFIISSGSFEGVTVKYLSVEISRVILSKIVGGPVTFA